MRRALALAFLVLALPAFGDDPAAIHIKSATVILPDDKPLAVGEGCYLRGDVCLQIAKEGQQLQAENAVLKQQLVEIANDPPASAKSILITAALALAVGAGLEYVAFHK